MTGDDKSKIIMRSADENYLNENVKNIYSGIIDGDNMHKKLYLCRCTE